MRQLGHGYRFFMLAGTNATRLEALQEEAREHRDMVAESGRPGRPELLAKKGRTVGGVGCPPNCRMSGKLRGSSDL